MHFFSNDYADEYVNGYREKHHDHGTTFFGTNGWVSVDRGGIYASDPEILKLEVAPGEEMCYVSKDHQNNFIECIRSRKQSISNIDSAVRSDAISHLGDVLIRSGAPELRWDPVKEVIVDPTPEMTALMHRDQRKPYDII